MTTTIHATGPLYVGAVWTDASLPEFFTVLHVLVWVVFELSLVAACAAMVVVAFSGCRDSCGPSRAAVLVPLALVVSFVTGASGLAAWAAGPDMGLLTLLAATGLVVAAGWVIGRCESRRRAAVLYAAAGGAGAGEQS